MAAQENEFVELAPQPAVPMTVESATVNQPGVTIQQAIQRAIDYDPEYQQIGWLATRARPVNTVSSGRVIWSATIARRSSIGTSRWKSPVCNIATISAAGS